MSQFNVDSLTSTDEKQLRIDLAAALCIAARYDWHEGVANHFSAAFRVSRSFVVFSLVTWVYAVLSGHYSSDRLLLLIIFCGAFLTALYTTVAIYRSHHQRIEELLTEIIHQLLGFAAIWTLPAHQQAVAAACVPSRELAPTSFEIKMPIYGTFDAFVADMRRWRSKWRRIAPPADPGQPTME